MSFISKVMLFCLLLFVVRNSTPLSFNKNNVKWFIVGSRCIDDKIWNYLLIPFFISGHARTV